VPRLQGFFKMSCKLGSTAAWDNKKSRITPSMNAKLTGAPLAVPQKPVVLQIQRLLEDGRVIVCDTDYHCLAMLRPWAVGWIQDGTLKAFSIIEVLEASTNNNIISPRPCGAW